MPDSLTDADLADEIRSLIDAHRNLRLTVARTLGVLDITRHFTDKPARAAIDNIRADLRAALEGS